MANRRSWITDDDAEILIVLALVAVWLPLSVVAAAWRWLRTDR